MTDYRRGPGEVAPSFWTKDRIAAHILTARQAIQSAKDRKSEDQ